MKPHCSRQRNQAMTLIEVVVVIVVIVWLALMYLPAILHQPRHLACYISCSNNLKQVALAAKIWAGDNNDKYPMDVSVTNGGAMEWMNTPGAWKIFLVMSNELSTPKVLVCPETIPANPNVSLPTAFDDNLKSKISYFIGLDAPTSNPAVFLYGDDNFLLNNSPANHGFVNVTGTNSLAWDTTRHTSVKKTWFTRTKTVYGNIGLGDGSVQELTTPGLSNQLQQTGFTTNRLFIP